MSPERKKALQKELDVYLSKRKGKSPFRKLWRRHRDQNVVESILSFFRKLKSSKMEEEFISTEELQPKETEKPEEKAEPEAVEPFEEELEEFEKPRRNFLQELIRFVTPTRKVKEEEIIDISEEAVAEEVESESKEDMKLLTKTVLGMLEHISPDEVKHLKNT